MLDYEKMEVICLKRIIKLVTIVLFVGLLAFVYFYFQKEEAAQLDMRGGEGIEADDSDYDAYMESLNEPLDTRLTYEKDMMFIYVSEMNNSALHEIPLGNLVDDEVSFNEETESIYFYNQGLVPNEDTEMVVLSEVYNLDTLLSQVVDNGSGDVSRLNFRDITFSELEEDWQPINNENRLFLNETLKIERLNQTDNIQVDFMEDSFVLKPGEYRDFVLDEAGVKSRILIRNFGPWETINMKYQIKE